MLKKFSPFWEKPDYLLIEAAKERADHESQHLTISQAVNIGKAIQAKHILITHIYPHLEKINEAFIKSQQNHNIQIVRDLQTFSL